VRLAIHGRFAELDNANSVRIGQENVPGIRTREFETSTKLRNGQTLAISGPTQVREEALAMGVPWLSDRPLFKIVTQEPKEVATIVLIRPEIVPPGATVAARQPAVGEIRR
jgi:type II secretory pathway component GspD/PulD (secretin)